MRKNLESLPISVLYLIFKVKIHNVGKVIVKLIKLISMDKEINFIIFVGLEI